MGKNYQGINGNWSGKIGPTVGRQKNGRTITAIYQPIVKNPKTAKQTKARRYFSMIAETFRTMAAWADVMTKGLRKYGTAWSNLLFINMDYDNTIGGSAPNYSVLYDHLELSRGNLLLPNSPTAVIESNALSVSWTDNTDDIAAFAKDIACLAVRNSVKGQWLYTLSGGERSTRQASMNLPSAWSGDSVDCWLSFRKFDGEEVSPSVYLGNFSM